MFIVIEGLDGAGKSTQVNMIREEFLRRGIESEYLHFPRFDAPIYGDLVARFLRGELGSVEQVDPYLVALIYAGDRAEASKMIEGWLKASKAVIIDRYVYSNIAYQCAKISNKEKKQTLRDWIFNLEYEHNKIVRPDVTLFLDVPFDFTKKKLTEERDGDDRDYLKGKEDIHEKSLSLQEAVRAEYLSQQPLDPHFKVISCGDGDKMLPKENIFSKICAEIF